MRRRSFLLIMSVVLVVGCSTTPRRPAAPPRYVPSAHRGEVGPNDILFRAIGLVGTPYRWGGNTPQSGFDCSGLIVYVFHEVAGIGLPRTVQDIYAVDLGQVRRDRLQAGDLVFFNTAGRNVSHIGIYVGQDRFVHAPNEGGTVRLDYLTNPYWDKHYAGAKRVPL
jgi:cell wall-associated NlpC family hydrolase